jgi:SAM-dependent methyltransferase
MNIEESLYDIDDLWKPNNIRESDIYRIKYLTNLIPDDVQSILDVGCGGGIFINHLHSSVNFRRIVGTDRSATALKYVNTEKVNADINALPFKNDEFDLVTCLEVIEHLPYFKYEKALEELCRVSNKYILISVPYNQNLLSSLCQCPICFTKFNPSFHMRSYNTAKLQNLLNNYGFCCHSVYNILKTTSYFGKIWFQDPFKLRKKIMPWSAICPVCGFHKDHLYSKSPEKKPITLKYMKRIITRVWPKHHSYKWLAALYIKY